MTDHSPIPARSVTKTPAMISVIQTVYFHPVADSGETEQFETRYTQILTQDEQPYVRVIQLSEQKWIPLEHGWIKPNKCSCIIIEHLSRIALNLTPSDVGMLEIGVLIEPDKVIPIMFLMSGTSLRFAPIDTRKFMIRCCNGTPRCKITLLPN